MGIERVAEQVVMFGPERRLVGIVAKPAEGTLCSGPAVVILNAGITHRVGPGRLHVRLARTLAAAGHKVLRFDLSGIGESPQHPGGLEYADALREDCKHAIDLAATDGANGVVMYGLCSGADNALHAAAADPRVTGLALVDPYVPSTRGFRLRWWTSRIASPSSWRNLLTGNRRVISRLWSESGGRQTTAEEVMSEYSRERVAGILDDLAARGVELYCLFNGGQAGYNYRRQFVEAFPEADFGNQLRLEFWPQSTHTFQSEQDKLKLIASVQEWMADCGFTQPQSRLPDAVSHERT